MIVAVAMSPVKALVDVTELVVLTQTPTIMPLTVAVTVQELGDGRVAPLKAMLVVEDVSVPLQVVVAEPTICTPEGIESEKATPVIGAVFMLGFTRVIVRVEIPLRGIVAGLNALEITGGARVWANTGDVAMRTSVKKKDTPKRRDV